MFPLVGSEIGGAVAVATPVAPPKCDWVGFNKKVTFYMAYLDSVLVFARILAAFQRG